MGLLLPVPIRQLLRGHCHELIRIGVDAPRRGAHRELMGVRLMHEASALHGLLSAEARGLDGRLLGMQGGHPLALLRGGFGQQFLALPFLLRRGRRRRTLRLVLEAEGFLLLLLLGRRELPLVLSVSGSPSLFLGGCLLLVLLQGAPGLSRRLGRRLSAVAAAGICVGWSTRLERPFLLPCRGAPRLPLARLLSPPRGRSCPTVL